MSQRRLERLLAAVFVAAGCSPQACQSDEAAVHKEVEVLIENEGPASKEAARRLKARGKRAIAILETGLYTAEPIGRIRIAKVLADLAHPEGVPILEHMISRDTDPLVRERAAEELSRLNAAISGE